MYYVAKTYAIFDPNIVMSFKSRELAEAYIKLMQENGCDDNFIILKAL